MRCGVCRSVGPVMDHVVLIESIIPSEKHHRYTSSPSQTDPPAAAQYTR